MQTEAALIAQAVSSSENTKDDIVSAEVHSWARLFSGKYLARTLLGVTMMFFQRQFLLNLRLAFPPFLADWNAQSGAVSMLCCTMGQHSYAQSGFAGRGYHWSFQEE